MNALPSLDWRHEHLAMLLGPRVAPAGPARALPDGTRILDFEVIRLLGQDRIGFHYLGWDRVARQQVVIKEYLPAALASRAATSPLVMPTARQHHEKFRLGLRCFMSEARLLTRFHHAAVVQVQRFWELNGTAYMALPCNDSPSLVSLLDTLERPVPEPDLRAWLDPLLEALRTLHAANFFHLAISPPSILLTPQGPLMQDFGAALHVIGAPEGESDAGYVPIELCEGAAMPAGPWSDLYALAAVMHAAVTGQAPIAPQRRLAGEAMTPLSQRAEGHYSAGLLRALDQALAVLPQDRPQSVAAFQALLAADMPMAMPAELASIFDTPLELPNVQPAARKADDWSEQLREFMGENGELPVQDGWWEPAAEEAPAAAPMAISLPAPAETTLEASLLRASADHTASPPADAAPATRASHAAPSRRKAALALAMLAMLLGASAIGYRWVSAPDAVSLAEVPPKAPAPALASPAPASPPAPAPAPEVTEAAPAPVEPVVDAPPPSTTPAVAEAAPQALETPDTPEAPQPVVLSAPDAPAEPADAAAQLPVSTPVQTASADPEALTAASTERAAPPPRARPVAAPVIAPRKSDTGARCSDIVQRASLEQVTTQQAIRLKEFCQ